MPTIEELQQKLTDALEQVESLKSEAKNHRLAKNAERDRAAELETRLSAIEQEKKKVEDEKLLATKDIDAILKRKGEEHEAQLAKVRDSATAWQKRYETKAIDEALVSAASKANAHDPSEIASLLRSNISLDDQGNVFVRNGDQPLMNDKGDRVGIDQFVTKYLGDKPHHVKATGAGAGSQGGNKTNSNPTITRSAFDALPSMEQSAFVKGGGVLTD